MLALFLLEVALQLLQLRIKDALLGLPLCEFILVAIDQLLGISAATSLQLSKPLFPLQLSLPKSI